MTNAPPAQNLKRSLITMGLCILPAIGVLFIAWWATKQIPSYHQGDIQDRLTARVKKPIANSQENSNSQPWLAAERPQTEEGYLAERQRILLEKRRALRNANGNANRNAESFDKELAFLEAEKKDSDERHAQTTQVFSQNTGRISWGSFTIAYLSICAVAAAFAVTCIWKVVGEAAESSAAPATPRRPAWQTAWKLGICAMALLVSVGLGWLLAPRVSNFWELPGIPSSPMAQDWGDLFKSNHLYPKLIVAIGCLF